MQRWHGLIIWFVATLFVVYSFCLNTAISVFSDAIKTTLHIGNFGVSIATGIFILGFALLQIPAGYLLDKFNTKYVVSTGILLLALGNLIISYADNLMLFTLSNLLQGVGASFAFIAAAVLIARWFSESAFPVLFGLTQTLSCILTGIIHYYFTVELAHHTWNELYGGLAVFGFILFLLSLLFVKSPPNYIKSDDVSLKKSLTMVFKNGQMMLCSIAAALSFGVLLAYASLWYVTVQNFYSVEHMQTIMISSFIFVGIGVGTPIFGWLSNKLKSRVMVLHTTLVMGAMALLLGIYLPHFDVGRLIIIKIVSFAIGFFLSGSMLFYTMISEIATDSTRGVAISVLNTFVFLFNTALLFIPYLFITQHSKEFFTYLWVLPFCIQLSILLVYFIKDTYKN